MATTVPRGEPGSTTARTIRSRPGTAGGTPAARSPRRSQLSRAENRWLPLFLAPWVIGFVVFTAGPMVASLVLSFTDYNVLSPAKSVGFDNYQRMLDDPMVRKSLWNTLFYTVLHVPLSMGIALALAVMLHRVGRAKGFFRTVFYLPAVTPPVAVGVLFLLMLNGRNGLINRVLSFVGIQGPNWTTDPAWIKPGIVIMSLWSLGTSVVIYLAALQNVPEELYDAARVDGATGWQQFRNVTLPMISGAIFFTLVINTIAALQLFTEVYTMFFGTAGTSSASDAASFYSIYLFNQAFKYLHMGYASALGWLLFLIILVITLVQLRVSRRFVYSEGD